jgi:hypothetical protein
VGPSQGPTFDRFLVRDVDLSARFDEVDRAALAEVLESSIGALVANERAGLTRAEAEAVLARREPPAAPPAIASRQPQPPPPALESPSRWAIGFFYAAQTASDDTLDHGPGVTISFAGWRKFASVHEQGRGPALFASAQYRLPVHESTERIGVALDTVAARAGVECGPLLWSRLRARLGRRRRYRPGEARVIRPRRHADGGALDGQRRRLRGAAREPGAPARPVLAVRRPVRRRIADHRPLRRHHRRCDSPGFFPPGASVPALQWS